MTLTIRDVSTDTPGDGDSFELTVPSERMTVRELIRERVYQEVDDHNRLLRAMSQNGIDPAAYPGFRGLVRQSFPSNEGSAGVRFVDWHEQFAIATDAFTKRRFLLLVGDHQANELDEMLTVSPSTEVTFVRLVLLVGG